LLKAAKLGHIKGAYEKAQELQKKGFYISEELLKEISKTGL